MQPVSLPDQIEASRLYLRKHCLELAETMYAYIERDRERLSRFLPWPSLITSVEDEIAYIEGINGQWGEGTLFDFGLFRKEDDAYMGNLGVHTINWPHDGCELGYWILGDFEGQGYMNEAVGALEAQLFEVGFHRIEIRCHSENRRSAQLPQRRGYQLDGTHRGARLTESGYADTSVYSKLSSDS